MVNTTMIRLVRIALVVLVGLLASWNLSTAPPAWYDEGVNLQAARNVARSGAYGLAYSADDVRPFDLQLTTGPTVILPVALAFNVFGVGLAEGRSVMVVYTLLAALGLYRAAGRLYGTTIAVVAVLVRCASDLGGPSVTRDVTGEVAALAYLFWGLAVFTDARRNGRSRGFAGAGLLFGLAVLTKAQFGLVLPAVVGAWLLTRGRPGGFGLRRLALLLAVASVPEALWQVYQIVQLGTGGYLAHLHEQSAALSVSAYVPPFSRTAGAILTLFASTFVWLGLAALAYVWVAGLRRGSGRRTAEHLVLPAFAVLWLAWFLSLSEAYGRYLVPLAAMTSLFLAVLGRDVALGWSRRVQACPGRRSSTGRLVLVGLVLLMAAPVVSGVVVQLLVLARATDGGAGAMAAIIRREVGPNTSTESIEWQLDVLAERAFHHPPPFVSAVAYEVPATRYLVDGPMSKAIGLYAHELAQFDYREIASVGAYDLYRRDLR